MHLFKRARVIRRDRRPNLHRAIRWVSRFSRKILSCHNGLFTSDVWSVPLEARDYVAVATQDSSSVGVVSSLYCSSTFCPVSFGFLRELTTDGPSWEVGSLRTFFFFLFGFVARNGRTEISRQHHNTPALDPYQDTCLRISIPSTIFP